MDCKLPGYSVRGIFQVRTLEWVASSSYRDFPDPGIEPTFPALAGRFTTEPFGKSQILINCPLNKELTNVGFRNTLVITGIPRTSRKFAYKHLKPNSTDTSGRETMKKEVR